MNYTIRKIRKEDDAVIENIIRTCLIVFGAAREGTAWADPDLGRFSEIYNTEGNRYWVAEDERGKVVGGVGIGALKGAEGICELQKMYCLPEARGTGVARELMDEALKYAERFYGQCYLETLDNMTAAQKFYESCGFRRIEEPVVQTEHFLCDVRYIRNI